MRLIIIVCLIVLTSCSSKNSLENNERNNLIVKIEQYKKSCYKDGGMDCVYLKILEDKKSCQDGDLRVCKTARKVKSSDEHDDTYIKPLIEPDLIRKKLLDNYEKFNSCYTGKRDQANTSFEVAIFEFSIEASGHVTNAKIYNDTDDIPDQLASCLLRAIKDIHFPSFAKGGVIYVNQPMRFKLN